MRRLTPRQEAFVEAYLRLQNGTQAYKVAYDKTGKMTDKVAGAAAARLLGKVKVQEALKARKEALQAINAVCTVEELAEGCQTRSASTWPTSLTSTAPLGLTDPNAGVMQGSLWADSDAKI